MKKIAYLTLIAVFTAGFAWAGPEVMAVKSEKQKTKERALGAFFEKYSMEEVEDPAARRAFKMLQYYLDPGSAQVPVPEGAGVPV